MSITTFIIIWMLLGHLSMYSLYILINGKRAKMPFYGYVFSCLIGPLFLPYVVWFFFEKLFFKEDDKS